MLARTWIDDDDDWKWVYRKQCHISHPQQLFILARCETDITSQPYKRCQVLFLSRAQRKAIQLSRVHDRWLFVGWHFISAPRNFSIHLLCFFSAPTTRPLPTIKQYQYANQVGLIAAVLHAWNIRVTIVVSRSHAVYRSLPWGRIWIPCNISSARVTLFYKRIRRSRVR